MPQPKRPPRRIAQIGERRAGDLDAPRPCGQDARHQMDERRLAGTAGTDDGHPLAIGDVERVDSQLEAILVAVHDVTQRDHGSSPPSKVEMRF